VVFTFRKSRQENESSLGIPHVRFEHSKRLHLLALDPVVEPLLITLRVRHATVLRRCDWTVLQRAVSRTRTPRWILEATSTLF